MAGFFPRKNLAGAEEATIRQEKNLIIANSKTITIGDAVALSSGFVDLVGAGNRVLGIVTGFVDKNGLPVNHARKSHAATISGSGNSLTVVTASNNQTVDQIRAVVCTDPNVLYYNDADDSLAQAQVGTYYDVVAASDQIDQSTTSTTGQFVLLEIDPDGDADASKGLFKIAEHALSI